MNKRRKWMRFASLALALLAVGGSGISCSKDDNSTGSDGAYRITFYNNTAHRITGISIEGSQPTFLDDKGNRDYLDNQDPILPGASKTTWEYYPEGWLECTIASPDTHTWEVTHMLDADHTTFTAWDPATSP